MMGRVLIVEDDPDVAAIAAAILSGAGHDPTIAAQPFDPGREDLTVDVVLLDLMMPEVNGAQVVRLIRTVEPDLPIVAFTAIPFQAVELDVFDGIVYKPFTPDDIIGAVEEVISDGRR